MSATYSFVDVQASIVDFATGANFPIGSSSGVTEEGITISQINPVGTMQIAADGTYMQVLHATFGARVTIRYLKTSPTNSLLMALVEQQRVSGALWGQNFISIVNPVTGDEVTATDCAFEKIPDNTYDGAGKMLEWTFLVGRSNQVLGTLGAAV